MPVKLDGFEEEEHALSEGMHRLGNQALQSWADSANASGAVPKCPVVAIGGTVNQTGAFLMRANALRLRTVALA
jgi:hypothetical protein